VARAQRSEFLTKRFTPSMKRSNDREIALIALVPAAVFIVDSALRKPAPMFVTTAGITVDQGLQ
jgi:hypothetical protein